MGSSINAGVVINSVALLLNGSPLPFMNSGGPGLSEVSPKSGSDPSVIALAKGLNTGPCINRSIEPVCPPFINRLVENANKTIDLLSTETVPDIETTPVFFVLANPVVVAAAEISVAPSL